VAIIVVNTERILLLKNKTPRDAIKIQNGKIITVDIGFQQWERKHHTLSKYFDL
jgi:hypothetical protein